MTRMTRERFRQICKGERLGDFGILANGFHMFWPETFPKWIEHGAPAIAGTPTGGASGFPTANADFFQLDEMRVLTEIHSGVSADAVFYDNFHGMSFQDYSFLIYPPFDLHILEEDESRMVFTSPALIKQQILKNQAFHMPLHLEYPVKDRASWHEFKKRLDPNTPGRLPEDWQAFATHMNELEYPVQLEIGGFFGCMNMWVGTENLMYLFYDDPELIDDMMECVLELESTLVQRVMKDVKVDLVRYWEDMAYKNGPMIGPKLVRRHMLPRYEKLNTLVRDLGCDICFVDSDGNIDKLIPIWIEAGINFVWPLEIAAHMDPIALRRKYGRELIMAGGLDKAELLKGKESIRREVMSKVPFLVETGPYFPSPDHLVPLDMPYEGFCYYINLLREIRGDGQIDFDAVAAGAGDSC